jgi:IS4 transposase
MTFTRGIRRSAFLVIVLVTAGVLGSAPAAADLGDYLWERRPLLVFAPTNQDPRLTQTLSRIEATQCEFADRQMVLGVVVADGPSTLDGQAITAEEAQRLADRYAVDPNAFAAVLIGKDGGEKYRVDQVPELGLVYTVIDGMPMRSRENGAESGGC